MMDSLLPAEIACLIYSGEQTEGCCFVPNGANMKRLCGAAKKTPSLALMFARNSKWRQALTKTDALTTLKYHSAWKWMLHILLTSGTLCLD